MVAMGDVIGSGNLPPGTVAPFRLGSGAALTGIRAPVVRLVLISHSNFRTYPGSWVDR
jgi:hypothetical protein